VRPNGLTTLRLSSNPLVKNAFHRIATRLAQMG